MRKETEYTHFGSLPFIRDSTKSQLKDVQRKITDVFTQANLSYYLKPNSIDQMHITLFMLSLPTQAHRTKAKTLLSNLKDNFAKQLSTIKLTTSKIRYYWNAYKDKDNQTRNYISVLYLDIKKDEQYMRVSKLVDAMVRLFLKQGILRKQELTSMYIEYDKVNGIYFNKDPHITLFWCNGLYEHNKFYECIKCVEDLYCNRMLNCEFIDISTRWAYDSSNYYLPLVRVDLEQKHKIEKEVQQKGK